MAFAGYLELFLYKCNGTPGLGLRGYGKKGNWSSTISITLVSCVTMQRKLLYIELIFSCHIMINGIAVTIRMREEITTVILTRIKGESASWLRRWALLTMFVR